MELAALLETVMRDGRPLEQLTLDEIAKLAGVSRATLLRRIGSRAALEAAARAAGVPVAPVASVRERAAAAAVALIEADGLASLTIERVAERAGCSVPAIYRVFENREGLLLEVFERFTPIARIEAVLRDPPPDLASTVRAIYRAHVEVWGHRPALVRAVIADLLGNPGGPARRVLIGTMPRRILPLVGRVVQRAVARGEVRPLPLPILLQIVGAPLIVHIASRDVFAAIMPLPPWEESIELIASSVLRAVAADPGGAGAAPAEALPSVERIAELIERVNAPREPGGG